MTVDFARACGLALLMIAPGWAATPFRVEVVDAENGWRVPLVELRTTHDLAFVTDNAGVIAVDSPELMDREVWFAVASHGYRAKADGFGQRGVRATVRAGGKLRIPVERTNVAKRLGRLTGAGLFAESQKLGEHAEVRDAGVFGCDSVQTAVYQGKHFWLWGDTDLPNYPLGVFHSSSATTATRPLASLQPPVRVEYDYFKDGRGLPRGVCQMQGPGPTWVSGYVSLPDGAGRERLVATYAKITPPLDAYEYGLCVWDDAAEEFKRERVLWRKADSEPRPLMPEGHPAKWRDDAGREWLLVGKPFPHFRCPATFEAWRDPSTWEALVPQRTVPVAELAEDAEDTVAGEAATSGATAPAAIEPHHGSIAWNEYRGRWVTVFLQTFGKPSAFGEVWYAEAPAPTGPWGPAVKVVSHDNYSFYNPRLHPEFADAESPVLLFEATYTAGFTDRAAPTPRYDYNQVLYRLDLDDPQLAGAQ
jgi:hypothetical protein